MEPPRERFERSISEQEERMKELLDNFKTEMMERFQRQNWETRGEQRGAGFEDFQTERDHFEAERDP